MPRPTIRNAPKKGEEERKRAKAEVLASALKLRKTRSDTGDTQAKPRAGEDQARPERSRRAMDSAPRAEREPEDYDEDKP